MQPNNVPKDVAYPCFISLQSVVVQQLLWEQISLKKKLSHPIWKPGLPFFIFGTQDLLPRNYIYCKQLSFSQTTLEERGTIGKGEVMPKVNWKREKFLITETRTQSLCELQEEDPPQILPCGYVGSSSSGKGVKVAPGERLGAELPRNCAHLLQLKSRPLY